MPAFKIPLSVDQLLAKSREMTGITLSDDEIIEPLTVLVNSMNTEGGLHEQGAIAQQNKLLRLLNNRLRMKRDFAAHPEIAEQKIEKPLFVIGPARSGTTKTQKVLSATGDFNWLPFWKTYNPALFSGDQSEPVQPRIDEAEEYCRWFDEMSPETKLGHSFETFEPEEDTTLTDGCFITPSFVGFANVTSYLGWLSTQDQTVLFEFLKDSLKYLQWQGLASESKRWLLKAPTYYGLEQQMLAVFPDADIVMTHRSPLQTVPSSCKLLSVFKQPFATETVAPEMLLAGFGAMMDQHFANRKNLPNLSILDVRFEDANKDMDAVVKKIYQHIGLPLSNTALSNIDSWDKSNPVHKHGKFVYSLEEFGLSEAQVREHLGSYFSFLESLF